MLDRADGPSLIIAYLEKVVQAGPATNQQGATTHQTIPTSTIAAPLPTAGSPKPSVDSQPKAKRWFRRG